MFKLMFVMVFWGGIALGGVYFYAKFTGDYELQNRIGFLFEDLMMHKDVIAQEFHESVQEAKDTVSSAKQNATPEGVARQVDLNGIVRSIGNVVPKKPQ